MSSEDCTERLSLLVSVILFALSPWSPLHAQPSDSSVMRRQAEADGAIEPESEAMWDSIRAITNPSGLSLHGRDDREQALRQRSPILGDAAACTLGATVFGWSPYWIGTAYNNYDYSLLSDVCYFSYEVNPSTGGYSSIHSWRTTGLVDRAKAAGRRVHLCVTLFSDHALFFANPTARATLIDSLVALVRLRNGDGVNIDFEAVPSSQRAMLSGFMIELGRRFHKDIPGSRISIALPAVDWGNSFDVVAMSPEVDLFIIMGYDYHWRASENAGPVSPKNNGTLWSAYDVTRSVNNWLGKGIAPEKLLLGLPYYGYEWPTSDSTPGAATLAPATAVLYNTARTKGETYGRRWEAQSSVPWYTYRADTVWRQGWYDDEESLGAKYDLVRMKRLAGIGIWALGYDDGRRELWNAIESHFTDCAAAACTGSFTDMGGPAGNYYNNESYTFTVAPAGARRVNLSFVSFSVADDTLQIYDGPDTTAPLIGSWTGQESPGNLIARSGALTFRFISDTGGVSWGWVSRWSCEVGTQGVRTNTPALPTLRLSARPNPSTGATTVEYRLNRRGDIVLTLVDSHGDQAATLYRGPGDRGLHSRDIDRRALALPAGSYFLRLEQGEDVAILRLVLR